MRDDHLDTLVHSIQAAKSAEYQHQILRQQVQLHHQQISRLVDLSRDSNGDTLYHFVLRYISEVPSMLLNLQHAAIEAGLWRYVQPVMEVALAFVQPKPEQTESDQIVSLLHQAYLVHRLLEEVNETYIHRVGQPMVPQDMTLANVIVHTLIEVSLVEGLERLVEHSVQQVFSPKRAYQDPDFCAYLSRRENNNLIRIAQPWPCMSAEMGMPSPMLN